MTSIKHIYTAIDCDDPISLAKFYSKLTGLKIETDKPGGLDGSWVELKDENNQIQLAFQKIANYRRPTWPEGPVPQQAHLDFLVEDLNKSENEIINLGATKTEFQPGSPHSVEYEYEFRVYLDPAGHPFCLIHDQIAD
jgi:hypothetical protein